MLISKYMNNAARRVGENMRLIGQISSGKIEDDGNVGIFCTTFGKKCDPWARGGNPRTWERLFPIVDSNLTAMDFAPPQQHIVDVTIASIIPS